MRSELLEGVRIVRTHSIGDWSVASSINRLES